MAGSFRSLRRYFFKGILQLLAALVHLKLLRCLPEPLELFLVCLGGAHNPAIRPNTPTTAASQLPRAAKHPTCPESKPMSAAPYASRLAAARSAPNGAYP